MSEPKLTQEAPQNLVHQVEDLIAATTASIQFLEQHRDKLQTIRNSLDGLTADLLKQHSVTEGMVTFISGEPDGGSH